LAIRQDRNAGLAGLVTQIDCGGTSANKAVSPMAGVEALGQYDRGFQGGGGFTCVGIAGPAERTGDIPLY
jgi:hypothetical protein